VSTAQVPKQGLNLHRESAFCVAPVAQVSALKEATEKPLGIPSKTTEIIANHL